MSTGMHELRSPWSKRLIGVSGVTASLVMLGVSGTLNYRYGSTLGASDVEKVGIGMAAVSADVFMSIALFFALAAWKKRERTKAVAGFVLWFCMTAICTWSAVSQISFNRIEASSDRQVTAINFDDLRKDLADARAALGFIPTHRPEAVVRAEIDGLKNKPLWSQTGECDGEVSGKSAREFCQSYQRLKSEIGSAQEANKIREKVAVLSAKSERQIETKGGRVISEADAGASTWANLTGMSVRTTQSIAATLFAGMLLVGTGIGLWVSVGTLKEANEMARERRPPTIDITPTVIPPPIPGQFNPGVVREYMIDEVLTKKEPPPEPPKLAAQAAPKVLAPVVPAKARKRPEPSDEARDMLTAIGFPVAPIRGQGLRAKDPREHCAWRFLAWLAAYHLEGAYPTEQIDALYSEFCQADHREPWGPRIVKSEMQGLRHFQSSTPEGRVHWTIAPPPTAKLMELLQSQPRKNPVIGRAPKTDVEAEESTILPFPVAAPRELEAASEESGDDAHLKVTTAPEKAIVSHRFAPDDIGNDLLARARKATS